MDQSRIAVLMTCHDRRETTMRCLASLSTQKGFREEDLFLVDDGSCDGTGAAVTAAMPAAHLIDGDGTLFWNNGMNLAWQTALDVRQPDYDWVLWLNDDVELDDGALETLLRDAAGAVDEAGAVICVGATRDGAGDVITYGGHRRPDPIWRPLRMELAVPTGQPQAVDTMSGNAVLVSSPVWRRIGLLDRGFEHIYGDLDYGLRAQAAGIPVVLASRAVGTCAPPPTEGTSTEGQLSLTGRAQALWREQSGVHARDWRRFVARHEPRLLARLGHRVAPWLRLVTGRPNRHGGSRPA